jgi:putative ABC transport system permease protein
MNLLEIFRIAWEAVVKNKIRSFLTMLGIIIGVAAVIIMVAISAGTEATIQEGITGLGSDLVFIQSSFSRAGKGLGRRAAAAWSLMMLPPLRMESMGLRLSSSSRLLYKKLEPAAYPWTASISWVRQLIFLLCVI